MKIQLVLLVALFSILSIQHAFATHLLKHKVIAGAAGAGLLLKPKLTVGGALIGKALLLPKVLIAGKIAKKALIVGAGAIVAKKIVKTIHRKKSCRRTCVNCVRSPVRLLKKRAISDYVNRGFRSVSTGLQNTGIRLRNVGSIFHSTSDRLRNASLTTRVAGILASDRIRTTGSGLVRNLVRRRRATRRPSSNAPANFQFPNRNLSLDEMLGVVRQYNAEECLQRVICQLSAKNNYYGDEGTRFGAKLLNYENVSHREAEQYREASRNW